MRLEVYRSYDGYVTGAHLLTIEADGAWAITEYLLPDEPARYHGRLLPTVVENLRAWLDDWLRDAEPNGWVEPRFGGCTAPIEMGALRTPSFSAHYPHWDYDPSVPPAWRRPGGNCERFEELYARLASITELAGTPFGGDGSLRGEREEA